MSLPKITYAEMAEVHAQYERLTKMLMDSPPDTSEFDTWLGPWCEKRGMAARTWKEFEVHVVPTEEHKK
jgi:hypothetical protein